MCCNVLSRKKNSSNHCVTYVASIARNHYLLQRFWLERISYPWDEGSAIYTQTVSRSANSEPHPRLPTYVLHLLVRSRIVLLGALYFAFQLEQTVTG